MKKRTPTILVGIINSGLGFSTDTIDLVDGCGNIGDGGYNGGYDGAYDGGHDGGHVGLTGAMPGGWIGG